MATRIYESARERLLDAAQRLILERGLSGLSVEAVISEVGLSKGGFFHHFKTKNDLILALLDRLVRRMDGFVAELAAKDPQPRGARLRAQIALSFDSKRQEAEAPQALLLAFVEAVKSQPTVRRLARELNAQAVARDVGEGIPEGRAMLIQFALDGFWLSEAVGTAALTAKQRRALRDELIALALVEAGPATLTRTATKTRKGKRS
ncbi:TetR/AcrR family transcriptional regulator [Nannocystis sp. SCPEA4]|uniref:TetR/AcrR family transcriptional regulator n=1 Tax=Nannocystis sp. SCPEA4 TaxID=2996787 RepID=UPI00226FF4C8|nr:TetR/AcrR family transcriptional regulator [Nannocystis sp. SCPEA4]MCY1055978.1 TetR/AcrR family transcriptional regulator [Nannocystis sp. SCPEA4]